MKVKEGIRSARISGGPADRPRRKGAGPSRSRAAGYTLIEVGLVIGLMGILAVAVADHYLSQLRFERSDSRVEGAVSDVRSIIDAAILWRESQLPSLWPNEADAIDAQPLVDDGFLPFLPPNRYRLTECGTPSGCVEYDLTGWDRGMEGGPPAGYTDDPLEAEDLVVQFNVWGLGEAKLIASQLPFGRVLDQEAGQLGSEAYTVEARVLSNALGGEYVLLNRESRPVVFAGTVETDSAGDDRLLPEGDLQQVGRITAGAPPVGTVESESLAEAVTPGIRLQPSRADMDEQGSYGGQILIDGPIVITVERGAEFTHDNPNDPDDGTTVSEPLDGVVLVMRDSNGDVIASSSLSGLQDQITNLGIALNTHTH